MAFDTRSLIGNCSCLRKNGNTGSVEEKRKKLCTDRRKKEIMG